jgi:hypothetical protein
VLNPKIAFEEKAVDMLKFLSATTIERLRDSNRQIFYN